MSKQKKYRDKFTLALRQKRTSHCFFLVHACNTSRPRFRVCCCVQTSFCDAGYGMNSHSTHQHAALQSNQKKKSVSTNSPSNSESEKNKNFKSNQNLSMHKIIICIYVYIHTNDTATQNSGSSLTEIFNALRLPCVDRPKLNQKLSSHMPLLS